MPVEQIGTSPKKVRGLAIESIEMIADLRDLIELVWPITGRGVGYKAFIAGLIDSMSTQNMKRIYRLLKIAREQGMIPWSWIVDETRALERRPSWRDPAHYADVVSRSYRRNAWQQQPVNVEVWCEKGTIRGVLAPVLDEYGVGFRVMHGFGSATSIHEVANVATDKPLIVLYCGDMDPSGLWMSKHDLPERLERYGGQHITLRRVAIVGHQLYGVPSFPAKSKTKDSRYDWYRQYIGDECWELDALDPNKLRDSVQNAIVEHIEPTAWAHCRMLEEAEQESLATVLSNWRAAS